MGTYNVNDLIQFVVLDRKSSKGNNYKAFAVQFLDKNGDIVLEKILEWFTDKQFEIILSLIKK